MKKFALAGNPNCGKTTLFNLLTGSTAYVGNWPGVTVEKREGTYKKGAEPALIVDLPGIYSLSPYTPEEVISRNYILDERPDCVINIVDATNLERNLYLTTQLMEIDVPMVIALNMMDAVEKAGDKVDAAALERKIGIPVVAVSALRGTGIKELMDRAIKASKTPRKGETVLQDSPVAHLIKDVSIALEGQKVVSPLFHAVKLSELDELETKAHPELVPTVNAFKATFSDDVFGDDLEAVVADARYKYISANFTSVVTKKNKKEKLTRSDRADKVLTHRVWGIPIFLLVLFAVFHLTFSENFLFLNGFGEGWMPSLEDLGMDTENFWVRVLACVYDGTVFSPGCILNNLWNDIIVGEIFGLIGQGIEKIPVEWVAGFLGNGVLEGIAAVLSFLPWILVLFLFFSILEDSGYMARVAFILDRIFRKFGLSGRAFMPMIMGFGCSIPATINTRNFTEQEALENMEWFPVWGDENAYMGMPVEKGFMFRHKAEGEAEHTLYKVLQPHTLSAEWVPGQGTESLYAKVSLHKGTKEDPIPYEQNMLIEQGKYYTQYDVLYIGLMTTLTGYPSDLKDMPSVVKPVDDEPEEPQGDGTPENPIVYVKGVTVIENGKYYTQDGVKYLCIRNGEMALAYDLADLVGAGYVETVTE